jgi:predicted nucleotidyltransferase
MPTLELQPRHLQKLRAILAAHVPGAEVWAYGSRVNQQSHEGSDLDLVARNPCHPDTPQPRLYLLRNALTESDLPFLVDVLDWARLPLEFRREIERQHIVIATPQLAK